MNRLCDRQLEQATATLLKMLGSSHKAEEQLYITLEVLLGDDRERSDLAARYYEERQAQRAIRSWLGEPSNPEHMAKELILSLFDRDRLEYFRQTLGLQQEQVITLLSRALPQIFPIRDEDKKPGLAT